MKKKKKPSKNKAWDLLSKIIRLSASDKSGNIKCYTCGTVKHWKEMQAGHAISGRGNSVLFDESIIRPQCVGCNIFKGGEYGIFAAKLIRENGSDWYEDKCRQKSQPVKFTNDYMEKLINEYQERLKILEG